MARSPTNACSTIAPVLAIQSPVGEVDLISKTPALVKICSTIFVRKLVEKALPGSGLTHMQIPPAAISARADTQYFSVSKAGPCWDRHGGDPPGTRLRTRRVAEAKSGTAGRSGF